MPEIVILTSAIEDEPRIWRTGIRRALDPGRGWGLSSADLAVESMDENEGRCELIGGFDTVKVPRKYLLRLSIRDGDSRSLGLVSAINMASNGR